MTDHAIKCAADFELQNWPVDKPFPLTDQQCVALCRGDAVRWPHPIHELNHLPGRCELLDGWLLLAR
jgi:hypothetical protein